MSFARWVKQDDVILKKWSTDKLDRLSEALQPGHSQQLLSGQQDLDVVGHGFLIYPAFSGTFTTDHWYPSALVYGFQYL